MRVCVCVSVLLKAQIERFVCLSLPLVLTAALVLVRTLIFLSNNSSLCVSGSHSRIGLCVDMETEKESSQRSC